MLICLLAIIQLLCITCVCCNYCCKSRQLKKQIGIEREKLEEQELEIQNPKTESLHSGRQNKTQVEGDDAANQDANANQKNNE